ncbi:hypothetical protein [Bacillus anthracis]|uniref:hypothetical protein n=1 Tax=Bacillus anthracis TaxID=1392 RepID=UPI00042EABFB|nr:hypothetical protein [Bacillus anthracis]AHK40903.1 hypothetical protein BAPAT_4774 [Bacillus anthracis str. SVA11]
MFPVAPVLPVIPVIPVGTGGKVGPTRSDNILKLEFNGLFILDLPPFPSTTFTTLKGKVQL